MCERTRNCFAVLMHLSLMDEERSDSMAAWKLFNFIFSSSIVLLSLWGRAVCALSRRPMTYVVESKVTNLLPTIPSSDTLSAPRTSFSLANECSLS